MRVKRIFFIGFVGAAIVLSGYWIKFPDKIVEQNTEQKQEKSELEKKLKTVPRERFEKYPEDLQKDIIENISEKYGKKFTMDEFCTRFLAPEAGPK
jgi:hypothetical protein